MALQPCFVDHKYFVVILAVMSVLGTLSGNFYLTIGVLSTSLIITPLHKCFYFPDAFLVPPLIAIGVLGDLGNRFLWRSSADDPQTSAAAPEVENNSAKEKKDPRGKCLLKKCDEGGSVCVIRCNRIGRIQIKGRNSQVAAGHIIMSEPNYSRRSHSVGSHKTQDTGEHRTEQTEEREQSTETAAMIAMLPVEGMQSEPHGLFYNPTGNHRGGKEVRFQLQPSTNNNKKAMNKQTSVETFSADEKLEQTQETEVTRDPVDDHRQTSGGEMIEAEQPSKLTAAEQRYAEERRMIEEILKDFLPTESITVRLISRQFLASFWQCIAELRSSNPNYTAGSAEQRPAISVERVPGSVLTIAYMLTWHMRGKPEEQLEAALRRLAAAWKILGDLGSGREESSDEAAGSRGSAAVKLLSSVINLTDFSQSSSISVSTDQQSDALAGGLLRSNDSTNKPVSNQACCAIV